MPATTKTVKIQIRNDTETNWNTANPTLLMGELGYDSTNQELKIGDGTSTWSQLSSLLKVLPFAHDYEF